MAKRKEEESPKTFEELMILIINEDKQMKQKFVEVLNEALERAKTLKKFQDLIARQVVENIGYAFEEFSERGGILSDEVEEFVREKMKKFLSDMMK